MTALPKIKNELSKNIKLSIQVRLNGLSFCTLNSQKAEILWYKKYDFPKEYNPVKILEQIEDLYNSEVQLQQPVDEVVVLFSHDLYNIVPGELFIEQEASNYLKFNTKILKTDVVAQDNLDNDKLVNIYIPFTNITNFFFDKYGEFEFKHSTSVLVQAVLDLPTTGKASMYLNNFSGYYDLVVIKNNELLLSNTFSYETKEDFIYYLLFTAEQLQLDTTQFDLHLLGDIDEDSPLYKIGYTYIKNISFFEPDLSVTSDNPNGNFQREAFILLKSIT